MLSKDYTKLRADVAVKHWEKRNSDIALYEINQEFEPQRLQLQQANQRADQAQREKISLYEELEMRYGLFLENHARDCQGIEVLRSMCCGEADQARIEESYDCESIHGSDSGITEQCKFFVRCERILRP